MFIYRQFWGPCSADDLLKPHISGWRAQLHRLSSDAPDCTVLLLHSFLEILINWKWTWTCGIYIGFIFLQASFFFLLSLFIYFEREREREREAERQFQAGSALSAQSLMQGLNSHTMRSWPEPRSGVRGLTNGATRRPFLRVSYFESLDVLIFLK